MIYLILAIISSTAISVVMRLSDKYVKNNMTMFASNYLICGLLSFAFLMADSGTASLTVSGGRIGRKPNPETGTGFWDFSNKHDSVV